VTPPSEPAEGGASTADATAATPEAAAARAAANAPADAGADAPAYARIRRAVSSPAALAVAFFWGVGEATVLFVVPDLWLGFVSLYAPRRFLVTLVAVVAGGVTGAALLFLATPALGEGLSQLLSSLPGTGPDDLARVRAELVAQGGAAFLNGPVQGLPVRLYVHAAALDGLDLPTVLAGTAVNRLTRIGFFGLTLAALGLVARPLIARRPRAVAVVYLVAWVIFYAWFWSARPA